MSYSITIPDEIIRAALVITKQSDTRTSFFIFESDAENYRMVVANGCILGVFRLPLSNRPAFSFAIPSGAFSATVKNSPVEIKISDDESHAIISQGLSAYSYGYDVKKIPFDWKRVISDTYSGEYTPFDPSILYEFVKIAKILGKGLMPLIIPNGPEKAASVKIGNRFFGLAMPFLLPDDFEKGYSVTPEWVKGVQS